jgi:hypothetical protein
MSCLNNSAGALAVKALGTATPVKRQAPVRGVLPLVLGMMSLAAASHSIAEPLPAPLVRARGLSPGHPRAQAGRGGVA